MFLSIPFAITDSYRSLFGRYVCLYTIDAIEHLYSVCTVIDGQEDEIPFRRTS
jgi:hypothetical protein